MLSRALAKYLLSYLTFMIVYTIITVIMTGDFVTGLTGTSAYVNHCQSSTFAVQIDRLELS